MSEHVTVLALARTVCRDFWRARRLLFIYEFAFKLLEAWLLVPAVAVVLAFILTRAGHVAVSNQDILDFLSTPLGLLYAVLATLVAAALLLFEQAGTMVLAALTRSAERPPLRRIVRAALGKVLRIVQLGAVQAGLLTLALLPLLLVAVLTYVTLLSDNDIYFYWQDRPPIFWVAAGIGTVLLLAALAVSAWLLVGWAFALPILLFENQFARQALRASRERVRGAAWRIGSILVGWLAGVMLAGAILEAGFRVAAALVLANVGDHWIVLILLLVAKAGLIASVSFVLMVGLGLITRRLYLDRSQELGFFPEGETAMEGDRPAAPWNWYLALLSWPLIVLPPLGVWLSVTRYAAERPLTKVTAHRGHARVAPENTLSAMRKAIASGADYAEMDVQLTADGTVVLLHDRDLMRVAGLARRLEEMTYDEVRQLDVGSWFNPAFAAERVPSLADVIHLCRGKMRLNIELKFYGPDRRLARAVAELLRQEDFESECIITSLNYDGLQEVKRHNPRLRTGLIVAYALGDISRLEVDALSIRADFVSDQVLYAAHRLGREVHVWTVNDERQMLRLMQRGVDNLITSDPDLAVRVRGQWNELTAPERFVVASRILLGLGS
jgi:glycerophosphoryl diester phosphodiesterase